MAGEVRLSARMKAVADMVSRGKRVCDVGCDHGYIPIYLIRQGISPGVLAMDIRKGPLGRAGEHIRRAGLEAYITLRLSDGLAAYQRGEAQTLICAGMGGRLIRQILERDPSKSRDFQELILQPQSDIASFRSFLRKAGFRIAQEDMVLEEGKFYPIIKALPETVPGAAGECKWQAREAAEDQERQAKEAAEDQGQRPEETSAGEESASRQRMEDWFGPVLLRERHPVLRLYLAREKESRENLREKLKEEDRSPGAIRRLKELEAELGCLEQAILLWGEDNNGGGAYGYDYN